jgi:hypothetical protein
MEKCHKVILELMVKWAVPRILWLIERGMVI